MTEGPRLSRPVEEIRELPVGLVEPVPHAGGQAE
jgi:hypothetical protein